MSDLVNFRPAAANSAMEPNGWAVVGLHTNFFAQLTAPQVQTGDLLGQPASVRFTAVRFTWDYGDGESVASGSAGSTWRGLGQPEFSPTGTSHVYRDSGAFSVRLSVEYVAEYQYADSGWREVVGSLNVASPAFPATVSTASTVLVERECTANAAAPGC